jgi:allophanate hydrolase subunit 2
MKVIGTAERDAFLLHASEVEVAALMGYRSTYDMERAGRKLRVGDEFDIMKTCGDLPLLRSNLSALATTAEGLRGIADRVDALSSNLYSPLRLPPKGENTKG